MEEKIGNVENLKELYLFSKDTYNLLFDEYEKIKDRVYKVLPVLTFLLGVDGYLIKIIIDYYKNSYLGYSLFFHISFLLSIFIIGTILFIIVSVFRALSQKENIVFNLEDKHIVPFANLETDRLYNKLLREIVKANSMNYALVTKKSSLVRWLNIGINILITLSLILFILFSIFLIIKKGV